jgi:hypothetical protein
MTKKRQKAVKKPLDELQAKARLALDSPALVEIARRANSPTAAQNRVFLEAGSMKIARACYYLRVIKREYGIETFENFVSSAVSQSPTSQLDPGKSQRR